jgi:hypothetical protein
VHAHGTVRRRAADILYCTRRVSAEEIPAALISDRIRFFTLISALSHQTARPARLPNTRSPTQHPLAYPTTDRLPNKRQSSAPRSLLPRSSAALILRLRPRWPGAGMLLDSLKRLHIWYTTKIMQGLVYVRTHAFELLRGLRVSQSRRIGIGISSDDLIRSAAGRQSFPIVHTSMSLRACGKDGMYPAQWSGARESLRSDCPPDVSA